MIWVAYVSLQLQAYQTERRMKKINTKWNIKMKTIKVKEMRQNVWGNQDLLKQFVSRLGKQTFFNNHAMSASHLSLKESI